MKNQIKNFNKKTKKGKLNKFKFNDNLLIFGEIGIKSLQSGFINLKQIDSIKQIISKKTKRKFKMWIKFFPFLSITAKSINSRMGRGKGKIVKYNAKIRAGQIFVEFSGFNKKILTNAINLARIKLPIKTKIIYN
jgi:large subunit ribosomal protein L16